MINRIKIAGKFGKLEHRAGRLTGLLILICIIFEYFKLPYRLIVLTATFFMWLIYLISHTLEKKFYGPGLRFNQRK